MTYTNDEPLIETKEIVGLALDLIRFADNASRFNQVSEYITTAGEWPRIIIAMAGISRYLTEENHGPGAAELRLSRVAREIRAHGNYPALRALDRRLENLK